MVATAQQLVPDSRLASVSTFTPRKKRKKFKFPRRDWTTEEKEILKANYEKIGIYKTMKLLPQDRTVTAVMQKARKLGVQTHRRWTSEEEQYLASEWEFSSIAMIARALNRGPDSIYKKASKMDLPFGAPDGCLMFSTAAAKMGFACETFRKILNLYGIKTHKVQTKPYQRSKKKNRRNPNSKIRKVRYHQTYVDEAEAIEAVEYWIKETEVVSDAAQRHGFTYDRLCKLLIAAGEKKPEGRSFWRVETDTIDRVVRNELENLKGKENLSTVAKRYGLTTYVVRVWMLRAGFKRDPSIPGTEWLLPTIDLDRVIAENIKTTIRAKIFGERNVSKRALEKIAVAKRLEARAKRLEARAERKALKQARRGLLYVLRRKWRLEKKSQRETMAKPTRVRKKKQTSLHRKSSV